MSVNLRRRAEDRLSGGTAPAASSWATGAEALTLLYRLASAPASAGDALKVLHELQVHQVELDLQHEESERDRQQLMQELRRHTDLFDRAPFAYLLLDADGMVLAANALAKDCLGASVGDGDTCCGRAVQSLLAPGCGAALQAALAGLRQGQARTACVLQAAAGGGRLQAMFTQPAASSLGAGQVLMACVPLPTAPA